MMNLLQLQGVSFHRSERRVIDAVDLTLHPGELLAVVGPNGSGKSTLLGLLSGRLKPSQGRARLDGTDLHHWHPRSLAQRRAVLSQHAPLSFDFTVDEIVRLGRSCHSGRGQTPHDHAQARAALHLAGTAELSGRFYPQLSGGEQQRVHLARAIAQILDERDDSRFLLLDEPEASLDIAHQHFVLAAARRLAARGIGVLAVLHELNLAARYADRVAIIDQGRLCRIGPPQSTLEPELLSRIYGITMRRDTLAGVGHPLLTAV